MTSYRLENGGREIRRDRRLLFRFDDRVLTGVQGDTLASALLANGEMLVGRSFKYHRPRGIFSAGAEEPNALVTVGDGPGSRPNTSATMTALYEGLAARSQNAWPRLEFDLMAVNGLLSPLFGAGFYYKTFMGPGRKAWMFYERFIRRAAGMGELGLAPDPDRYEKLTAHCDVLIVGSGPAGLMAARHVVKAGLNVMMLDEHVRPGGQLRGRLEQIDGQDADAFVDQTIADLTEAENFRLMTGTTAFGYFDDNVIGAVERLPQTVAAPDGRLAERSWRIHAKQVIIATGAHERPYIFHGNDLPGVMLLGAARDYAVRHGVAVGQNVAICTNNDAGWLAAGALAAAGVRIAAIADPRVNVRPELIAPLKDAGVEVLPGELVVAAKGGRHVRRVGIATWRDGRQMGGARWRDCDAVLVSGGYTPTVHLCAQAGSAPVFDDRLQAFLPGEASQDWIAAGAVQGAESTAACLEAGQAAGMATVRKLAPRKRTRTTLPVADDVTFDPLMPLYEVPDGHQKGKKFVDLQHDVTAADVRLAAREGYTSVEHLKRYTTLGMAGDQGKTSNILGMAVMAKARGIGIAEVGTTRYRQPYTPVTVGALAGRNVGGHLRPVRKTPMHDWHVAAGADMLTVGPWMRPQVYRRDDESVYDAYVREAKAVRAGVGMVDVSTLGKIEVQGPDAAEFLNRLYANGFKKLPVGKARYGAMLREDGIVMDDGTTWRLAENRFLVTTTTANAGPVMTHMEYALAIHWPELRVHLASVTEQWAGMAVSGPNSRDLLAGVVSDVDFSDDAFPFMGVRFGSVNDVPVMVARLSFSGELAYEVYAPSDHGLAVWQAIWDVGQEMDIIAYGTEALGTLRIEKGHVAGPELNGRTTLDDLGLGRMASKIKPYVGSVMKDRDGLTGDGRLQLVGVVSTNRTALKAGSHLVAGADPKSPGDSQGHVTSTTYSPAIDAYVALALLKDGRARHGEELYATFPLRDLHMRVKVVDPVFFDRDGSRLNG